VFSRENRAVARGIRVASGARHARVFRPGSPLFIGSYFTLWGILISTGYGNQYLPISRIRQRVCHSEFKDQGHACSRSSLGRCSCCHFLLHSFSFCPGAAACAGKCLPDTGCLVLGRGQWCPRYTLHVWRCGRYLRIDLSTRVIQMNVEDLLEDAHLVSSFGQRAGVLKTPDLFTAIHKAEPKLQLCKAL
jgi:hypothetical protein